MPDRTYPVLIDGTWRSVRTADVFQALNPETGAPLPGDYPISPWPDVEDALTAGVQASREMAGLGPGPIAGFLDSFADRTEARKPELVAAARLETALPSEPRLGSVEFPRLINQLRQAAEACRDRSWSRATIDTETNLRSMFGPLGGPVAVFGPSNFPFAYNALGGGDFAAALAAGNPVIAKSHPGHPSTTRILAEAAWEALRASGLPRASVQLLYHFAPDDGLSLVSHPSIGAAAFTGSRPSGMALKMAADRAGKPIYLEMSSANPVFLLPGSLAERPEEIAGELVNSCFLAAGQMCTKPGLTVLIESSEARIFLDRVGRLFEDSEHGILLGPKVFEGLREAGSRLSRSGAELIAGGRDAGGPGYRFRPTLFRLPAAVFLGDPAAFQVESFGTLSLVVLARDFDEMVAVASSLEGHLAGTVYTHSDGRDDREYATLEPILRCKVGRLLNDRMPTGVTVSPAMNHGGPYPATGHPGFTAVGFPAAILRFAALRCYDHVRPERLPPELRDKNPNGRMWRFIDGAWTRRDL